jgi:N-acetylglucosamine repressor
MKMKVRTKILSAILHDGPCSQAELARKCTASPSAVSEECRRLMDEGILLKAGSRSTANGRSGVLLEIDITRRFAVGIGVCHGVMSAGIITLDGRTLEKETAPISESDTGKQILIQVSEALSRLFKNCCLSSENVLGIGVCMDSELFKTLGNNSLSELSGGYPIFFETADEYLAYSQAYMPINPEEMYVFGGAKVIRELLLKD